MGRPAFGTKKMNYPDELWSHFVGYKKKVEDNPRIKIEYVGKNGTRVETPLKTPLTIEGFKSYCWDQGIYIHDYLNNTDGRYSDFTTICSRIKNEIREDQIIGGMCGQYNASITQRLNALKEHTSSENSHNISVLNIDPLDDSSDNSTSKDIKS